MTIKLHEVPAKNRDNLEFCALSHHRCDPRTWRHLLDPTTGEYDLSRAGVADDVIVYPVSMEGQGFPTGVPFRVHSECPACFEPMFAWFVWKGPQLHLARL